MILPVTGDVDGETRLSEMGLMTIAEEDKLLLEEPFGGPYADLSNTYDFYGDDPVVIKSVQAAAPQPPKELMFLPALLLLAGVVLIQRRRAGRAEGVEA